LFFYVGISSAAFETQPHYSNKTTSGVEIGFTGYFGDSETPATEPVTKSGWLPLKDLFHV
jgi:hypothetical protein